MALCLSVSSTLFSQSGNIAINKAGNNTANPSAILDLSDASNANLGLLLPSVTFTSSVDATTIPSPQTGLIVYNPTTSVSNGLSGAGFYYWTGSQWDYLSNSGYSSAGVSSVGLTMPSIFSVSGSPITSAGTLTATLNNENANLIFAGPSTGSPAAPTFRAMTISDLSAGIIPNANLQNSSFTVTAGSGVSVSGSPVSLGGTVTITASGSTIASVAPGTEGAAATNTSGLTISPITSNTVSISLAKTAVTAGTYGSGTLIPVLTVNDEGQVTAASTISAAAGTVTSVSAGTPGANTNSSGLTFATNPITSTGSISIANGGVSNAMLATPTFTAAVTAPLSGGGAVALGGTTTIGLTTPLAYNYGGTGTVTAPVQYGVMYAPTATTYSTTAQGAANTILAGNTGSAPTFQSVATLLGSTYIQNQFSAAQSASFNIQSVAAANIGGVIEGASGQTANLINFDNSAATPLASVSSGGNVTSAGLTSTGTVNLNTTGAATTTIGAGTNTGAVIIGNTTGNVGIGTTTPVNLLNANGTVSLGQPSSTGATTGTATFYNNTNANTVSIQAGSLASAASYSLTLPLSQGAANSILTNNGSGTLSWTSPSTLITANNGVTETGTTVQLGGALIQSTSVNASASNYPMEFDLGTGSVAGTGTFSVNNGGTANPYLYVAKSTNGASVGIGNNSPGNNILNVSTATTSNGVGNGVNLAAQAGAASSSGGAITIKGGAAGGSNTVGGGLVIAAGTAGSNTSGSNVSIQPSAFSSSGTNGGVAINNTGATPTSGALVDMASTTAGLLIPRVTYSVNALPSTVIASPAAGLLVFNTTTGCFVYYNGSAWQAISCECYGAPGTPASISGVTTMCAATSATYTVSSVSGATSYTWSISSGAITAGQGTSVVTITAPASGTFTLSATATNPCGTSSAVTDVITTTTATPTTGTITGSTSICLTSNYTTSYTSTATGATYYVWAVPANVTINSGQGTASISVTFSTTATSGNITCTPYSYNGGCAAAPASLAYITGTSSPGTQSITPACGTTLITSYSTSFSVPNITGNTYSWTVPGSVGTIIGSSTSYSVSVTTAGSAGSGTISVTVTNGCGSGSGTLPVTIVGHGVATYTTVGTSNWTVPCGVTTATIYLFGGGGGGGGSFESSPVDFLNGGGGGGGACGTATISGLTGGNTYTVTVGAGGAGGTTTSPDNGSTGGSTTFVGALGTWDADGGAGGTGASLTPAGDVFAGGPGGSTGSGTGITIYSGGAGNSGNNGTGSTNGYTGTGGGGAGSGGGGSAPLSNATSCDVAGGAGGPGTYPGGAGGYNTSCGGTTNSAGSPGNQPGGGGSGDNNWTGAEPGSNGGNGEAIIVY